MKFGLVCAMVALAVSGLGSSAMPAPNKVPKKIDVVICPMTTVRDLSASADAALQAGDYRLLSVAEFWSGDSYPGIVCPGGKYDHLNKRGGVFYSDAMQSCPYGWQADKARNEAHVKAFNRTLASSSGFQLATGCHAE